MSAWQPDYSYARFPFKGCYTLATPFDWRNHAKLEDRFDRYYAGGQRDRTVWAPNYRERAIEINALVDAHHPTWQVDKNELQAMQDEWRVEYLKYQAELDALGPAHPQWAPAYSTAGKIVEEYSYLWSQWHDVQGLTGWITCSLANHIDDIIRTGARIVLAPVPPFQVSSGGQTKTIDPIQVWDFLRAQLGSLDGLKAKCADRGWTSRRDAIAAMLDGARYRTLDEPLAELVVGGYLDDKLGNKVVRIEPQIDYLKFQKPLLPEDRVRFQRMAQAASVSQGPTAGQVAAGAGAAGLLAWLLFG